MSYLENDNGLNIGYRNGQKGNSSTENALNTIDLFTGSLKLPLTLCHLEGRDDLSVTVQAGYMQNNPEHFHHQNRKLANTVLGYGWGIGLSAIMVKNRQVKQSYQKEFYLIGEGGQYPLYRNGRTADDKISFFSVEHPNWQFYLYDNAEHSYWEILHEDGSRHTYGGSDDSNEKTLSWDNWIGPLVSKGAESFISAWYFSAAETSKGAQVQYQYDNVMETLAGASYTRTVRLKRIQTSYDHEILFHYEDKEAGEYGTNHSITAGDNAYQEKYEDKYLKKLDVRNEHHVLMYSQELIYELVESGTEETKRRLTEIAQITAEGTKRPALTLAYKKSGEFEGLVEKLQYPLGTGISYNYEKTELSTSDGYGQFDLEMDWESKIYKGNDFEFVLLQREEKIKFHIYQWDITWRQHIDDSMVDESVSDVQLQFGNGFICLSYLDLLSSSYKIKIIKRSPVRRFDWEIRDFSTENSPDRPSIACGTDFVAVQYTEQNSLNILQYKYTDNDWHENTLEVESRGYQALGAGDGFIFGAYGDSNSDNIRLQSFYSDEDHNWQIGGTLDVTANVDWALVVREYVWSIGYAQASACFINHEGNSVKTTLVLLTWTDGFQFTDYQVEDFEYTDDTISPYIFAVTTDTLIGYAEHVYRYTPQGWVHHKLLDVVSGGAYKFSYASDMALAVENVNQCQRFYAQRFDPYRDGWTTDGVPQSEDLTQIKGTCQPLIAGEYAVLGRYIFTRTIDDTWINIGDLEQNIDYAHVQIDAQGGYLLYQLIGYEQIYQVPFENGALSTDVKVIEGQRLDATSAMGSQAGLQSFYTFNSEASSKAVHFYQLSEKKYKDKQHNVLIRSLNCDYGVWQQDIYLQYDMNTVRLENDRCAFQTTTVYPVDENGSSGKTEFHFFNGASVNDYDYPDDKHTNVKQYYSHMCGRLAHSIEYDGDNNQVNRSENSLKAMDTLGFTILQTRLEETRYFPSYDMTNHQAKNTSSIKKATYIDYEDQYFLKRKIKQVGLNAEGKEVQFSTEFRYLWEDDSTLLEKNALSDVVLEIKKEETSNTILGVTRYTFEKDSSNRHYQTGEFLWDHTASFEEEGEQWVTTQKAIEVNTNLETACTEDIEGTKTTYLYDQKDQFIVAAFDHALPEEVLYCGFEPYENLTQLNMLEGRISEMLDPSECFSGTQSLRIEPNNALSINLSNKGTHNRISLAAKTQGEITITWRLGSMVETKTYPAAEYRWQQLRDIFSNSASEKGALTVTITGTQPLYIDALFLSPSLSLGEAYVYTGAFAKQSASHKNHESGERIYLDRFQNPAAIAGDDGSFISLSRQRHGQLSTALTLNETLLIEFPSGGRFHWMDQWDGNSKYWSRADNCWEFIAQNNFALFTAMTDGQPTLTLGELHLEVINNTWLIKYAGGLVHQVDVTDGQHFTLLKVGHRIQLSCEDTVIYEGKHPFAVGTQLQLAVSDTENVDCMGFAPDPKILLSFTDFAGKSHQDIAVTETGIIVGQTLYNPQGQAEITTKKLELQDVLWSYQQDLVTHYNSDTGILEGLVADTYPEDDGFPYDQIKHTKSPSPKQIEMGQAGKQRAIEGDGNTMRFDYYINEGQFHHLQDGTCTLKLQKMPDGISSFEAVDVFENKVMSITYNEASDTAEQLMRYQYDHNGNLTHVFYPNYFSGMQGHEQFFSTYTYNVFGKLSSQKEPDASGYEFIYDRAGKLRFKNQASDSGRYLYYVYDTYTRMIEQGTIEGEWDPVQLELEAQGVGIAPAGGIARVRNFYDGDGTDQTLLRKLSKVESFDDDGVLETVEKYRYDLRGNIREKTTITKASEDVLATKYDQAKNIITCPKILGILETVEKYLDDLKDNIKDKITSTQANEDVLVMEYDHAKNMTSYRMDDVIVTNIYDILSRLVGVKHGNNLIYTCSYLPCGQLAGETFLPEQEGALEKNYTYDSAMWLKGMQDRFFEQELEYADTGSSSGLGGRITKSISRHVGTPEITFDYSYDAYGRLQSYERNGIAHAIDLDLNGNQVDENNGSTKFQYEEGTNKLLSKGNTSFQYDPSGNVTQVPEHEMLIKYDNMFNKPTAIQVGSRQLTYTHGVQGHSSKNDGTATTFVNYDMQGRLLSEMKNGVRTLCIYGANGMMAQIQNDQVYFLIKDYQSSVRAIYDGNALLATFSYDPFGQIDVQTILDESVETLIPIRFTSARLEATLDLYTMRYRIYSPSLGRFLNLDPENQHTSPYLYCGSDWVNYFDPDGAFSWAAFATAVIGIVLIGVGVAITVATGGLGGAAGVALGMLGAGLIGGGAGLAVYGVSSAISGDFNLTDALIAGGLGFVFGAVAFGVGAGIAAAAPTIGSTATTFAEIGSGVILGANNSVVSNGITNIREDRAFTDGWATCAITGAIVGGIPAAKKAWSNKNTGKYTVTPNSAKHELKKKIRTSLADAGKSVAGKAAAEIYDNKDALMNTVQADDRQQQFGDVNKINGPNIQIYQVKQPGNLNDIGSLWVRNVSFNT
ncbi:RHS repeat-associated core domain-containing protein [Moritella sp.]|uniref:RHS repeat domain-containing protein n=1 Tax=Moritella sp. TaxID=78556 RepID=UPI001DBEA438|nr:RHS repeat-associated core domain-containing protein [Moritella sp.]MCJ8350916.1 RHS repeat-associated core domain-containing protein [Moritella sp.]NQZ40827.1 RHS repeat-associated core domain-containing protein [Moritella sp.]